MTAGRSILEMLWDEMLNQYGKLLAVMEGPSTPAEVQGQKGTCLGIAKCIAIMTNPYDPDVDAIRRETKERHEQARDARRG